MKIIIFKKVEVIFGTDTGTYFLGWTKINYFAGLLWRILVKSASFDPNEN